MDPKFYNTICTAAIEKKKLLAILLDPDKTSISDLPDLVSDIHEIGASCILVGGSLMLDDGMGAFVRALKSITALPVCLFPGGSYQVTPHADAILFLSLVSGRNPDYLIHNQVLVGAQVKASGIECIPTGYILIDGGRETSVSYISNTKPIPRDKADIAVATAIASELLGQKLLYLEAGSGAQYPVPAKLIAAVKSNVDIPVIVGGGIRTAQQLSNAYDAGADLVVIGTAFEESISLLSEFKSVLMRE